MLFGIVVSNTAEKYSLFIWNSDWTGCLILLFVESGKPLYGDKTFFRQSGIEDRYSVSNTNFNLIK